MRRIWQPMILVAAFFAAACGFFSCESPIEKERRELREATESSEAVLYRGLKVALRSAPLDGSPTDESSTKIRQLTASVFTKLLREGAQDGQSVELTPADYVVLAKEFYELRDELRDADEDAYPTLLHQIVVASGDDPASLAMLEWYDPAWEHLVLAFVWTGSQKAPQGFVLHELNELDPDGLEPDGVRVAARLVRSLAFYQYHWPWLADEELTAYLDDLAASRADVVAFTRAFAGAPPDASDDFVYAQWHAPGVLLRGIARFQKALEDEALDDLDAFLVDAQTLGIDDEGVWLVGAYVGIRREDPERALENLRKLEASPLLDDDTRKLVRESIEALEKRDPDSAFNVVTDKLLVAKIAGGYLLRVLAKVNWREQLERSESGRALLRSDEAMMGEVERTKAALSPDQLDGLTTKASESARDVGERARRGAVEVWHRAAGE
ncbi:MAG TPA: hypothetical protein VFG69_19155 [Nannocystaceae bacterium]|nr:hypothetical protein [Nannocystaceae bacterium]